MTMGRRLSESEIDDRLSKTHIRRVGAYAGGKIPTMVTCLRCSHTWPTRLSNIINNGHNCPACSGNLKYTNDIIDIKLQKTNIKRLDEYTGMHRKISFKCEKCDHTWRSKPDNIINGGKRCPACAGVIKHTIEEVDNILNGMNIKRLGSFFNVDTPMLCACLLCGYGLTNPWHKSLNAFKRPSGCPVCASHGFKPNLPASLYVVETDTFTGFGISNECEVRLAEHSRKVKIKKFIRFDFSEGRRAQQVEKILKKNLPIFDSGIAGFRTEATKLPFDAVCKMVENVIES